MQNLTFATLASFAAAAGGDYDYLSNGADWPDISPDCGLTNQSPIDLSSAPGSYPEYPATDDAFTKSYENQADVEVKWVGDTTKTTLNAGGSNGFTSNLAESVFGANKRYDGAQFHFHSGSEHTIDGKRFEFEMHTVHLAEETLEGFGYAAFGIIFSVNDFTADLSEDQYKIIDDFFDSLDLSSQDDPVQSMVTYGDLMNMVDGDNRYVYKGSVTTPPCGQSVYWNVLSTVYPIQQRHVDLFKAQLERADQGTLRETGNWREIQQVDLHNVIRVTTGEDSASKIAMGLFASAAMIAMTLY